MSKGQVVTVYYGPGGQDFDALPLCGGGGVTHVFTPCFAGAGASLEVHFLDANGQTQAVQTYTLSSTPVGVFGLTRTGSNFLTDLGAVRTLSGPAKGFIAYARTAAVTIGRWGDRNPLASGTYCDPGATLPETLSIGDALAWCQVADSNGWDVRPGGRDSDNYPIIGRSLDDITPSDSTVLSPPCMVWVGVGGDVAVIAVNDTAAKTLPNAPSGSIIPVLVTKVMATNTTATSLKAIRSA